MLSDLRFALRQLRKSPGFTAVALLTLALGIGANTAIFSVVNAMLLRPLPFPEADRIVQVSETPAPGNFVITSAGVFMDWQDAAAPFEALAAIHPVDKNLTGRGEPVRLAGAEVSADYLNVLRVTPALGRGFIPADDAPGGNRHVVVLTHELWQTRFNADRGVLDRTVQLDGENFTVIGVLPPRALLETRIGFLVPSAIRADAWKHTRDYHYVCTVIGRLKTDATLAQASAVLNAAKQARNADYPVFKQPWGVGVRTLQDATFGQDRAYVLTLFITVALVLLIACANVANLLLAKAATRQTEVAVRTALGASPARIVRQLLTESLLLAAAGGLLGIILGAFAIEPLFAFAGGTSPYSVEATIDGRVLLFSAGAALVTGVLFGLFPALSAARPDLVTQLKEGTRGSTGGSRRRLQTGLVVGETALTVVLLVTAGMQLRSFTNALQADPGFQPENVLVFDLTQAGTKAPTVEHRARFVNDILDRVARVPGVVRAGMASSVPMNGVSAFGDLVSREDQPETRNNQTAAFDSVAGGYFESMGIPLLRGRFLADADNRLTAPRAMLVNAALARQFFGDEDPLGRLLHFKGEAWEIVGVVGDVRQFQLDFAPRPAVYFPQIHFPWHNSIVVRTSLPPLALADAVRRAVREVDPDQPIANVRTLEQSVRDSLRGRVTMLTLLAVFAGTALLLACLGIYGVVSYSVAQRTREMGIRLALGAGTGQVLALVFRHGLKLVAIGLTVGLVVSGGTNVLLASQLFGLSAFDPWVMLAVAPALLAAATLACWLPARRATQVDPLVALRAE